MTAAATTLKTRLWLWSPVVLYVFFIFWLSSAPRPVPGFLRWPGGDKLFHTIEYAPLGSLLSRALRRSRPAARWKQVQGSGFLGAMVVGIGDEWTQSFTPLRMSSPWDAVVDACGAALGQSIYWLQRRRQS